MKNYYDELEVSKTASKEVIEKVYKVLAKKYHPDTTKEDDKQSAEEKFKIISEAYEILSDDEKRKRYDLELEQRNPTISYEDYMNVVKQRDALNSNLINLQNQFNQFKNSYNANIKYNSNYQQQSEFNQTQHQKQERYNEQTNPNFNSYQKPNTNTNNANTSTRNIGKKYYYNTVTGQPVSAMDYYKYRIKKFLSNIGFYILLILLIIILIKNINISDIITFLL